jgi:hypothetical protein
MLREEPTDEAASWAYPFMLIKGFFTLLPGPRLQCTEWTMDQISIATVVKAGCNHFIRIHERQRPVCI